MCYACTLTLQLRLQTRASIESITRGWTGEIGKPHMSEMPVGYFNFSPKRPKLLGPLGLESISLNPGGLVAIEIDLFQDLTDEPYPQATAVSGSESIA